MMAKHFNTKYINDMVKTTKIIELYPPKVELIKFLKVSVEYLYELECGSISPQP